MKLIKDTRFQKLNSIVWMTLIMAIALQTGFIIAAKADAPATTDTAASGNKENWISVSDDFTKQIGADDVVPVYRRRSMGMIVTPNGDIFIQTQTNGICVSRDRGATWSVVDGNNIKGKGSYFSLPYPYDGRMALFCWDGSGGMSGGMSLNDGKTWKSFSQINLYRGLSFGDLDWNSPDPQVIFGLTHEPYYSFLSKDGGKSWQRIDSAETGSGPEKNYCLGVVDAKTLLRANPMRQGGIIELSTDAGQTWASVASAQVIGWRPVHYGKNLYWTTAKGVIVTSNGKDWNLTGPGAEGAHWGPYFGTSEQEFVVVTDKNFLKTEDGGRTWTPIAKFYMAPGNFRGALHGCYFGWDAKHNILYASGGGTSVYQMKLPASTSAAPAPAPVVTPAPVVPTPVPIPTPTPVANAPVTPGPPSAEPQATSPGIPPVLKPGVWTDITPAETKIKESNRRTFCLGFAIDPRNPAIIYLCVSNYELAEGEGLYKTTDGGTTWKRLGPFDAPIHVLIDPNDSNHVYCVDSYHGKTKGFWVSSDGGETWKHPAEVNVDTQKPLGLDDMYCVAADPTDFSHILVSFHSTAFSGPWKGKGAVGIVESWDGGEHWKTHDVPTKDDSSKVGCDIFFLYDPAKKIGDAKTWLFTSQLPEWYRTENGGVSWTQVYDKKMTHGATQLYWASNNVLYAGAVGTPARSTDNGKTWTALPQDNMRKNGMFPWCYVGICGDGTNLYTAGRYLNAPGGYYYTSPETDGLTWKPYLKEQTFLMEPFEMHYDAKNGIMYASHWQDGFWALKIGGQ